MIKQSPSDDSGRILRFRHRRSTELAEPSDPLAPPDELAKFERGSEPDDYRHRMLMNAAAFAILVILIGGGLWLATTMAEMRKNQDCVLSGRRGCTPVDVPHNRW